MRGSRQHEPPAARGASLRPARLLPQTKATALLCAGLLCVLARTSEGAAAAGVVASPAASAAAIHVTGVTQIRHGTAHDALYDVAFEGQHGIAVGAFGSVLETADGGASWQVQPFPMKHLALMAVTLRAGKCIAVGQTGLVFTADDCKSWQPAPSITKSRLLAVGVNSSGLAYAVGAFGTVLKSSDWGKSWAVQAVDWKGMTEDGAEPHLYGVHVGEDGVVTAVGEFELVLRSSEGTQWKALHKGQRSLFGLTVVGDGHLYATGQSGALLSSADGGTTWQSHQTGTEAILTGVYATPRGEVLASGINTAVLSRDGGASWKPVDSKLVRNAWCQALAASEPVAGGKRRVVGVGAAGSIVEFDL